MLSLYEVHKLHLYLCFPNPDSIDNAACKVRIDISQLKTAFCLSPLFNTFANVVFGLVGGWSHGETWTLDHGNGLKSHVVNDGDIAIII